MAELENLLATHFPQVVGLLVQDYNAPLQCAWDTYPFVGQSFRSTFDESKTFCSHLCLDAFDRDKISPMFPGRLREFWDDFATNSAQRASLRQPLLVQLLASAVGHLPHASIPVA